MPETIRSGFSPSNPTGRSARTPVDRGAVSRVAEVAVVEVDFLDRKRVRVVIERAEALRFESGAITSG